MKGNKQNVSQGDNAETEEAGVSGSGEETVDTASESGGKSRKTKSGQMPENQSRFKPKEKVVHKLEEQLEVKPMYISKTMWSELTFTVKNIQSLLKNNDAQRQELIEKESQLASQLESFIDTINQLQGTPAVLDDCMKAVKEISKKLEVDLNYHDQLTKNYECGTAQSAVLDDCMKELKEISKKVELDVNYHDQLKNSYESAAQSKSQSQEELKKVVHDMEAKLENAVADFQKAAAAVNVNATMRNSSSEESDLENLYQDILTKTGNLLQQGTDAMKELRQLQNTNQGTVNSMANNIFTNIDNAVKSSASEGSLKVVMENLQEKLDKRIAEVTTNVSQTITDLTGKVDQMTKYFEQFTTTATVAQLSFLDPQAQPSSDKIGGDCNVLGAGTFPDLNSELGVSTNSLEQILNGQFGLCASSPVRHDREKNYQGDGGATENLVCTNTEENFEATEKVESSIPDTTKQSESGGLETTAASSSSQSLNQKRDAFHEKRKQRVLDLKKKLLALENSVFIEKGSGLESETRSSDEEYNESDSGGSSSDSEKSSHAVNSIQTVYKQKLLL